MLVHAHYQNEQGRPNAAFLVLGKACRTALAAGLHKQGFHDERQSVEEIESRRITFWCLYCFETYVCSYIQ